MCPADQPVLRPLRADDRAAVERVTRSSGYFSAEEVDIALEVFDAALADPASGYAFVVVDVNGRLAGYACWGGPAEQTQSTFELYWIAVAHDERHRGLGRLLLSEAERCAEAAGAGQLIAETSGRSQYASTHAFYERCGWERAAELADFYAPGDAKVFYVKRFGTRG